MDERGSRLCGRRPRSGAALLSGAVLGATPHPDALISAVFVINVLGSLALGIVGAAVNVLGGQDAVVYAGLSVGLLGGFTTFSTAMVEAVQALLAGRYARFVMLWLVQPTLSLIVLITGYTAATAVLLAVFSAR